MYLSRFLIGLVSTILGCCRLTQLAAAFGHPSLLHYRISTSKVSTALRDAEEEEQEVEFSHEELMDEAVLLYSIVSRRTIFTDNTEAETDILKLRGEELSLLIKDSVFDAKGIVRDEVAIEENIVEETRKEPETLHEISQALDDQILLGYQATFNDEELEEWIRGIGSLQQKLQSQLTVLTPGSDWTTETLEAAAPKSPTPLDKMHVRLETMRTLINPVGRNRLRFPLAQPIDISKPKASIGHQDSAVNPDPVALSAESNTENDKSETTGIQLKEEETPSKLDIENAFIASINEAAASRSDNSADTETRANNVESASISLTNNVLEEHAVPAPPPPEPKGNVEIESPAIKKVETESNSPSGFIDELVPRTMEEEDAPSESELENASIESINKAVEDDAPSESELENAWIESMNKAVEDDAPSDPELENASIESMNNAAEDDAPPEPDPINGEVAVAPEDGTDIVSTVATTVVLGAAAVTKLPIVLAGVALGPVIRDSITYAKSRTKKASGHKETSKQKALLGFKPKTKKKNTPKPKARSTFDPKPTKKSKAKSKSKSDSGKRKS